MGTRWPAAADSGGGPGGAPNGARRRGGGRAALEARLADLATGLLRLDGPDAEQEMVRLVAYAAGASASVVETLDGKPRDGPGVAWLVPWGSDATRGLRLSFSGAVPPRWFLDRLAERCQLVSDRIEGAKRDRASGAEAAFLAHAALRVLSPLDLDGIDATLDGLLIPHLADWFVLRGEGPPPGFATTRASGEPEGGVRLGFELRCRGRAVGTLALGRRDGLFTAADARLLEQLAELVALAADNARIFQEKTHSAVTLERSLLPAGFLPVAGLDIASRYVAASRRQTVGGDFYDAVCLPGGGVTLIVGDVEGKGVEAATLTSLARHTLRAAALDGAGPATMLCRLNRALRYGQAEQAAAGGDPVSRFVTAAVVMLTPRQRGGFDAVVACGGQPPPVLLRSDGTITLVSPRGVLLGVSDEPDFREERLTLERAETLVLYTDGVTEQQRGDSVFDEMQLGRLVRNRLAPVDAAEIANLICETVLLIAGDVPRDDIAILVACVTR